MTQERPNGGDAREDQAIAWLVRLNAGDAGVSDWTALEAWLAADPDNLAALARVEALWGDLDDQAYGLKRGLDAAGGASNVIAFTPRRARPAPAKTNVKWAAAAAIVLALGAAGTAAFIRTRPTAYETAPGQIRHIVLADGARIDLNGASRLTVKYDRDARRVTMADAEADFDVTRDTHRPFLITAGDQRIAVLGTVFDVSSHDGRLVVTVRRGVVEVARPDAGGALTDVARVAAGYQLVRRAGEDTTTIRPVDPEEAVAWRQRRLVYHDTSLASVAADLNRAFAIPIEPQGAARGLRFFGGTGAG